MSVKEEIAPVSASQTAAPPSLLDEIMAQTRVQPKSESYDITRQGVSAFIAAMLQGDSSAEPINILAVDAMIADIDARTSRQMDAIIHAPEFQELESLLRSLKLLVERADTRENIKVHFLNVTQKNCWMISNLHLKSRSLRITSMYIQAVTDNLAVSQWRR